MTSAELDAILTEAISLLDQNGRMVTPDLLDQIDKIIAAFDGAGSSGLMTMAENLQGIDLPKIIVMAKLLVTHERKLIAGMGQTLMESAIKVQGRPLEVALIAKFL